MSDTKQYYWLKLKDNFFERDEIKIIESQPNGKDYIIFYMKLLLKSVKTEGKLFFRDVIPYTPEMLASITNTSVDTVKVAVDMFTTLGLMARMDDGALFMAETQYMIGKETTWAIQKREQRATLNLDKLDKLSGQKRTMSGHCPPEIDIELDIDKEPPKSSEGIINSELKKQDIVLKDFDFNSNEQQAINDWLAYKKEKRQSYKPLGLSKLFKSLQQEKSKGCNIIEAIDSSITNNWQGIVFNKGYLAHRPLLVNKNQALPNSDLYALAPHVPLEFN